MRRFAGLVALWCLFAPRGVAAQAPGRISVYTYSRDSAAGFKDDRLDIFRRELGRYIATFMEVAYDTESAQVRLLFLGPGELSVALGPDGETEHHLFTPEEKADRTWVVLRVETFSKEFSVLGSGGRDLTRLAKSVSDWLSAHTTTIRERYLEH